jgi:hypothetical protein
MSGHPDAVASGGEGVPGRLLRGDPSHHRGRPEDSLVPAICHADAAEAP